MDTTSSCQELPEKENEEEQKREQNVLSIHHGGRVDKGKKIVAQIMLEACFDGVSMESWMGA
eukprot:5688130-Ditylum_brightwellii.AAC.1